MQLGRVTKFVCLGVGFVGLLLFSYLLIALTNDEITDVTFIFGSVFSLGLTVTIVFQLCIFDTKELSELTTKLMRFVVLWKLRFFSQFQEDTYDKYDEDDVSLPQ